MSKNKHVIILGAGSSCSSGYPAARQLTKLMADPKHFFRYLNDLLAKEDMPSANPEIQTIARNLFAAFEPAAKVLKDGSFATMDELSNLAFGGSRASDILTLKQELRLVFGMDNPHVWHWGSSDYPSFVNAIFQGKETPRDDICVLSFNYDPYLDFLLDEALLARHSLRNVEPDKARYFLQAATSGFCYPHDLRWLSEDGFSHLKLHGTSAAPETPERSAKKEFTYKRLLCPDILKRFQFLYEAHGMNQHPPVLLPWEIIHPTEGRLLSEAEFQKTVGPDWPYVMLYSLFKGIWERARTEVQNAERISFIGISMGKFLEPELKYLFRNKHILGNLSLVVANPSNETAKLNHYGNPIDRHSPVGRVYFFLRDLHRAGELSLLSRSPEAFEHSVNVASRLSFTDFISFVLE
jgi:hypothetical protein